MLNLVIILLVFAIILYIFSVHANGKKIYISVLVKFDQYILYADKGIHKKYHDLIKVINSYFL